MRRAAKIDGNHAAIGRSKYRAKPTVVDGIRFASQKEARRYQELKLLERAGSIRNLRLQPRYELRVPSGYISSMTVKVGTYVADFAYDELTETGGRWDFVVEDVKGFRTPFYNWKKRHVEAQYGLKIRET